MTMVRGYICGLRDSLVIVIGYVPVAVVFGASARAFGFTPLEAVLASALIFAGMSQFILISLINSSLVYAIFLASFVNLRHVVYGCALAGRRNLTKKSLIAFGLTDEIFALSISKQDLTDRYVLGLVTGAYLAWVLGTLVGSLFTEVVHSLGIVQDLEFALVALFIAILVSYVNSLSDLLTALCSAIITVMLYILGLGQVAPLMVAALAVLANVLVEKARART